MYDVEVIGAGPSGSYAANALARRGFSVHLVDRATFPRDKLCGGGLTRKSLGLIRELEPSFDTAGLAEPIEQLYLFGPDGKTVREARLPVGEVALIRRRDFDAWWRDRALDAGAEFSQRPVGLDGARFLVAADGAGSSWGRSIRGPFRNSEIAVASECHASADLPPFAALLVSPNGAGSGWGYSWLFGRSDGVLVGTGYRRDQEGDLPALRGRILLLNRRFTSETCSRFDNWVIPLYHPRPAAQGRVALVGDALGVADPFLAEGIANSMASSRVLVESFVRQKDFSQYTAELHRHPYFRAMRYFEFLQQVVGTDGAAAFQALSSPGLFERLRRMLSDPGEAAYLAWGFALRHPVTALRARRTLRVAGRTSPPAPSLMPGQDTTPATNSKEPPARA
jgi:flavin-dependent dehydrogenase